jgi:hypothetical protein
MGSAKDPNAYGRSWLQLRAGLCGCGRQAAGGGSRWQEALSRKRVLNRAKNIVRDSQARIARFSSAMGTILRASSERIHMTLSIALLAACVANLALVCAWL